MIAAYLSEALRLYILVVLVASSVGKARAIGRFAETLEALVTSPLGGAEAPLPPSPRWSLSSRWRSSLVVTWPIAEWPPR